MKITDALGCMGWTGFFLLVSAGIPIIGPLISLLTPLPFLYYSTKLGFYQGIRLAVLALFSIGIIVSVVGYPQLMLLGVEFGFLGLALSQLFKKRLDLGQTVFLGTVFMLLLGMGFVFFVALSKNMGPLEMVLSYLQDHLKLSVKAYEEMGFSQEKAIELEAYGKIFMNTISKIYPSLVVIGTGFTVWLNVVVSKSLFRVGNLEYPDFVPMDRWQAPDVLVWVVIVSGFALFLFSGSIRSLAINVLIILMAVYFFHGLSITLFFMNRYHVPSWIRAGVYFLIIIQQLFFIILALAGLFDQWIDFRKINKRMDS